MYMLNGKQVDQKSNIQMALTSNMYMLYGKANNFMVAIFHSFLCFMSRLPTISMLSVKKFPQRKNDKSTCASF